MAIILEICRHEDKIHVFSKLHDKIFKTGSRYFIMKLMIKYLQHGVDILLCNS
jgi:hypothetical protein